jgi:hypothetical protein
MAERRLLNAAEAKAGLARIAMIEADHQQASAQVHAAF